MWPIGWTAFVLAEGWPSWVFALDGLGCLNIAIYSVFSDTRSQEEFYATCLGKYRQTLKELLSSKAIWPCVFVQGSSSFCCRMRQQWGERSWKNWVKMSRWTGNKEGASQRTSHKQSGGVTTSEKGNYQSSIKFLGPNFFLLKLP